MVDRPVTVATGEERRRVLVVDDQYSVRHAVRALLEDTGHLVDEAPDGARALAAVRRSPPDVVLMDLNMPGMDGIEAARRIKQVDGSVEVVLFTAAAPVTASLHVRLQAAGVREVVPKGVEPDVLLHAVAATRETPGVGTQIRRHTSRLLERIADRSARVMVLGQGYVGLSLAAAATGAGFQVVGVDVDSDRVDGLRRGLPMVPGAPEQAVRAAVESGLLTFTTETTTAHDVDVVVLCVPTPLRERTPDLSAVHAAAETVARRLRPGQLVVLESTTFPGTTDETVRPILERSGLTCGEDFLLAYSPERIDPGNREFGSGNTSRLVGGTTRAAASAAEAFYGQFTGKVVPVSSCRVAEAAKLLENTFRSVNIALVNELATFCHDLGVDVWEVVEAAATKPFGFMPFRPGPGVGGHCIPLAPTYLSWETRRRSGRPFRLVEQARDVNEAMPAWVAGRIGTALGARGRPVRGAQVLLLGVTYKADVGDVRGSPALGVLECLRQQGVEVAYHDPHVPEVNVGGQVLRGVPLDDDVLTAADCVAVLTPHRALDLARVVRLAPLVFDACAACGPQPPSNVVRL